MELTGERVLQETARIAFFDVRKLFRDEGSPKSLHDLDDDTAAAISGLDLNAARDQLLGSLENVLSWEAWLEEARHATGGDKGPEPHRCSQAT